MTPAFVRRIAGANPVRFPTRRFSTTLPLALSAALLLTACGGDSTGPPAPTTVNVASPTTTLTALGETVQLTAQVMDGRGNPMTGQAVNWASGNTAVLQVSASGLVTAVGTGSASVTASAGTATGSVSLSVQQQPSALTVTGGVGQEGEVGTALPQPISFRVEDSRGNPVGNAPVALAVAGGGSVPSAQVTTDAAGVVQVTWTLGNRVADTQELTATAATVSRAVTATPRPGAPSDLVPTGGTGQTGLAGEPLSDSLVVQVQDRFGNPVPAASVSWSVVAGGGGVSPQQGTSSADGSVRAGWVLGPAVGLNRARASLAANQAEFQANGLPNGVIAGSVSLTGAFLAPGASEGLASGALARSGAAARFGASSPFAMALSPGWQGGGGPKTLLTSGPLQLHEGSAGAAALLPAQTTAAVDTVPGQWIVRLRGTPRGGLGVAGFSVAASRAEAAALRERLSGIRPVAEGRARVGLVSPVLGVARLELATGVEGADALRRLREDPEVEWIEPVLLYRALPTELPGVEVATVAWSEGSALEAPGAAPVAAPVPAPVAARASAAAILGQRYYPRQSWHYGMMDLPRAWELSQGNPAVVVAVVDDGIRFDHPSISARLTNDGYDFVSAIDVPSCSGGTVSNAGDGDGWDPDPTVPIRYGWNGTCSTGVQANGGHGLHVAGTIAASSALVGVAPDVRIRPVRVLGTIGAGTNLDIAVGLIYAAGLPVEVTPELTVQVPTAPIINLSLGGSQTSQVMEEAVALATAAGSLLVAAAGNEATTAPSYPAGYPQTLSVSALRPDFGIASYSNRGTTIDVAAPGGELGWGSESGIWSTYWRFTDNAPLLAALQGTSMAAPHVSGVAALLLSHTPGLSAGQLRDILIQTATDLGTPGKDGLFGHGMVNAFAALTRGQGFPAHLRVYLTRAGTGERVASAQAGSGGTFRFPGLVDGDYRVHAGLDDRGNGITGRPGALWGSLGGSATPTQIPIEGHGVRNGSFTIGYPLEVEPNGIVSQANELAVGGYSYGTISPSGDLDLYRVRIPTAGTYTIETHGIYGMCGWGLEVDTVLDLLSESGQILATHDDIDASLDLYCSRITAPLDPGTYIVRVRGFGTGQYAVSVR